MHLKIHIITDTHTHIVTISPLFMSIAQAHTYLSILQFGKIYQASAIKYKMTNSLSLCKSLKCTIRLVYEIIYSKVLAGMYRKRTGFVQNKQTIKKEDESKLNREKQYCD